jgi:hypothetical protein
MVGTKPMRLPARCHFRASRCMAATEVTIRISEKLAVKYDQSM